MFSSFLLFILIFFFSVVILNVSLFCCVFQYKINVSSRFAFSLSKKKKGKESASNTFFFLLWNLKIPVEPPNRSQNLIFFVGVYQFKPISIRMDPKNDAEQKDFDENSNKLISECGIPIFIQYASNLIAHLLATSLEPATLAAESPWRTSPLRSPTRSTTPRHLGFSTFHFLEVWSRYYSNLQPKGNGPDLCFW